MAAAAQHSTTSLNWRPSGEEPYQKEDFCNSFWGPGDDGVNILMSRMRGATRTTEELKSFWNERAAIEDQYATRLATLAKSTLGSDEIGDLKNSLDALRQETENQAAAHMDLAAQIRSQIEGPTSLQYAKQVNHRRNVQSSLEKKFKTKQSQEAYVSKAREKYESDCSKITAYTQQLPFAQGKDLERLQLKLKRAQQTVQANEKDFSNFTKALLDMLPGWEADWKDFCDQCQDMEEDRLDFVKDILWAYANEVSMLCVRDDESCERVRTILDQMEPERDIEYFVANYGTGSTIQEPPVYVPFNGQEVPAFPTPKARPAQFLRTSRRQAPTYDRSKADQAETGQDIPPEEPPVPRQGANGYYNPPSPQVQTNGQVNRRANHQSSPLIQDPYRSGSRDGAGLPRSQPPPTSPPNIPPPSPPGAYVQPAVPSSPPRRVSRLPTPTHHQNPSQEDPPPPVPLLPPQPPNGSLLSGGILFYVKALYDYTATIEEEFDFQAGDVIAVTATPDDGWWSGELLDEARREEGRHVFPSNFVCLF